MEKTCTGCVVSAGTHKPADALHQIEDHSDGWIQDGPLLYRLTDERKPKNRDEINVLMADGSRTEESRTRRAGELLDAIRAAAPQAVQAAVPDAPIGQTGKYKSGDRIVCTNAVNAKFITEGREYVAGIMGRNPGGVFVVADDGEESEYRADRFIAAPAHPAEGEVK